MKRPALLLAVSLGLFAAWVGWLGYLAATARRPVVLSRPQLLVAELVVIAQVDAKPEKGQPARLTIQESYGPPGGPAVRKTGTITVENLHECEGWQGPGVFILPLAAAGGENVYRVVSIP